MRSISGAGKIVGVVQRRRVRRRSRLAVKWDGGTGAPLAVIPGATSAAHIKENLNLPALTLTEDEMRAIAKLDRGQFVIMDDEKLA